MALYLRLKDRLGANTQAFLYKWTHIPTQKWYVGSRTAVGCHIDDGYICSSKVGKPMIMESRDEWRREILVVSEPRYIRKLEGKYLTLLDAKHDPMSFNADNAAGRSRTGIPHTEKTKIKIAESLTGSHHSVETCKKMSETRIGSNNPFYGKHHTVENIQATVDRQTGVPRKDITKQRIKATLTGTHRPENVANKISLGVKNLPTIQCDHCSGDFKPAQFGRWHGDNCKSRNTNA